MGNNPENKDFYLGKTPTFGKHRRSLLKGKVKSIGVSNFDQKDLQNIFDHCDVKPMVNQFIYHIGFNKWRIITHFAKSTKFSEGYSPIATGRLLSTMEVKMIAEAHGKSIPQLSIRYPQKDILPLPKISFTKNTFQIMPKLGLGNLNRHEEIRWAASIWIFAFEAAHSSPAKCCIIDRLFLSLQLCF